jgi:two-component system nitrogen regulation sensor histidine kinase NtrY
VIDETTAANTSPGLPRRALLRFQFWSRRVRLERNLAIALSVAAVVAGVATFGAMTGNLPVAVDTWDILLLLNLDLVLLLALGALIGHRLVYVWVASKRGAAGARLHARLVGLFSLLAVTPTIIIAVFSVIMFDFGLQGWFSQRVRTAVSESVAVAEAYLEEHQQVIKADILAMAQDLNRQGPAFRFNTARFNQLVETQTVLRSLTEAVVFDGSGRLLARAGLGRLLSFQPQIPEWAVDRAREGKVVILTAGTDDRVHALVELDGLNDIFLYVGRPVDQRVLAHMDRSQGAAKLYEEMEGQRSDLQIRFAMIFVVVALLLLLAAIWVGLAVANNLSRPIGSLIFAAKQVGAGDLSARVDQGLGRDEIGSLLRAFNSMTSKLESQQHDLLDANEQLDSRRRFIEAVLSGVTAGVIGLDREGRITLPNRSACELLQSDAKTLSGRPLAKVMPEIAPLLNKASRRPRQISEAQIVRTGSDGTVRSLFVRILAQSDEDGVIGFVVTIDEITELLAAQRKAAWADVARRIAHEIKNPLTPIQLSAERLKRRYLSQIENDSETFEACTDTIVRQVAEIGRMVDEFSSFARMPEPSLQDHDLGEIIRQTVFLQKNATPQIDFHCDLPDEAVVQACDSRQIARAILNLLQNAADAIAGRPAKDGGDLPKGEIRISLADAPGGPKIEVQDNGRGLPKSERHRLTEPYVTTRAGGTGLGLAIVRKIMEDHDGKVTLEDVETGGARVTLHFPPGEETPARGRQRDSLEKNKAGTHGT